ncbi:MAG: sulfotransferase [Leptolyngbyaceae cyanobacterium MO_188.B28]|nr:sulfotransferase [Leptolyngbyaceae cyanobacterium MO_188.B28]
MGNQKSGTSAIAALLAKLTGLSATLDLKNEFPIPTYPQILQGQLPFSQFRQNYELDFSRNIVKEPNLTLLYPELAESFPESKFVFILRDPRDNIRSILNRLKIPGNLSQLSPEYCQKVTPAWKLIIDNRWLGLEGENYIEMLSARWNYMADVFLNNQEQMVLVRYEAFLKDKLGELTRLADKLGLNPVNDITHRLDVQFQRRGDRDVKWQDFFGNQNLAQIEHICAARMRRLGYPINRELQLQTTLS